MRTYADLRKADAFSARIERKPPLLAVFFRLQPRVGAGCCGFMFTSRTSIIVCFLALSLSGGRVFSKTCTHQSGVK